MIAYLKGKVIDIFDGGVVLENGGIGYELLCTSALFGKLTANKEGGAYTYLQVREDGLSLFGFDTKEEKGTFLKLIAVSGVGPKMAMGILSGMSVGDLATAIATNDIKSLSKVKGLGKKQRNVLFSNSAKAFPKAISPFPPTSGAWLRRMRSLPRTRTLWLFL